MNNIYGSHDTNTIEQFHEIQKHAKRSALMADGHLGYVMPIGGVAGYQNSVSIVGVGYDIACGNMAIRLDCKINDIDIDYVLDEIPQAYRRLDEVLAFHNETIKIKYTLKPVGVVMCNE